MTDFEDIHTQKEFVAWPIMLTDSMRATYTALTQHLSGDLIMPQIVH
jgi:hypothetical protein